MRPCTKPSPTAVREFSSRTNPPQLPTDDPELQSTLFLSWCETNRDRLQTDLENIGTAVSEAAGLVQTGNPDGEAILGYAISSRNILASVLEVPDVQMLGSELDDVDEFRVYQAVLERCKVGS